MAKCALFRRGIRQVCTLVFRVVEKCAHFLEGSWQMCIVFLRSFRKCAQLFWVLLRNVHIFFMPVTSMCTPFVWEGTKVLMPDQVCTVFCCPAPPKIRNRVPGSGVNPVPGFGPSWRAGSGVGCRFIHRLVICLSSAGSLAWFENEARGPKSLSRSVSWVCIVADANFFCGSSGNQPGSFHFLDNQPTNP